MSDYLDYENNLAFDPTSADDLNEQKRKSDVLIKAIEKCEKLEKQLKIAESWLREIGNSVDTYFEKDNRPLEFTLDVLMGCGFSAQQALHDIKELDRKATPFWALRILKAGGVTKRVHLYAELLDVNLETYPNVEFQKAYRKNPERMTFEIKDIKLIDGKNTDLHYDGMVFDIELGDRIDVAED